MNHIISQIVELWKNEESVIDIENNLNLWFQGWNEWLMQHAIERIDKELYQQYKHKGWHVDNIEPRTVQFVFGKITYYRRRLKKEGRPSFIALDKALGLQKYKRYSPNTQKVMAQLGANMPYRQAKKSLLISSSVTASHSTIHRVTQEVGEKVQHYLSKYNYKSDLPKTKRKKVKALYIEGDGLLVKGRQGDSPTIHRVIVHEGIDKKKQRHTLINKMAFSSLDSSKDAFKQAAHYLNQVYDLKETLVITNSDGGSGYEKDKFDTIVGYCHRHEHFRDTYHVHRKVKERLSFDKKMEGLMIKAVKKFDWSLVESVCATAESRLIDIPEESKAIRKDQIKKLKKYLYRNWKYIKSFKQRDLPLSDGTGVCETGHRVYSYRTKRQGRSWTKAGVANVVALLTAEQNSLLEKALTTEVDSIVEPLGEDLKGAVRQALKKPRSTTHTVQTGKISNYGPVSSFIGKLGRAFS